MKYGELTHFSHPQHKLRVEYSEFPFKCDGCKEVGIGSRFKCSICDYDLHKHCALPQPNSMIRHPFYPKCTFQFLSRPPGNTARYCNACQRDVHGFVYHCFTCGFDLHPCCANLPHVLDAEGGVRLFLYRKVGASCHRCGRRGRSWTYRTSCKKYNLHVACVMEMLVESWHEIYIGTRGGGGGWGNTGTKGLVSGTKVPIIRGAGINQHRRKGKMKKCCEVAALAVQFIISAVLGDPTAIIAGVVGSFISR
ncbi:uncharacterized protein LOC109833226 [Asparagus officinalis]|nr:uncharacterized protein LOC109833226 [Asparagus officinalis]